MLQLPIIEVIRKICSDKGLTEDEVKVRIKEKQKQLGDLVSAEGSAYIVASELGVTLFKELEAGATYKVKDIIAGMRNVDVVGKVLRLFEPRIFKKADREGQVGSFILADETGDIRVTIWDERVQWLKNGKLAIGKIVKVQGGYSKESQGGGRDLHLSARSNLILDVDETVDVPEGPRGYERKKLAAIGAGDRVQALGVVVQTFVPHFYKTCPECLKKVESAEEGYVCPTHKTVEPKDAMIFSFVLDDGTGSVRCVAFRDTASSLINMSSDDAQDLLEMNEEELHEKINEFLLGNMIELQGRINLNKAFGRTELVIDKAFLEPDPKIIIERLSKDG